MHPRISPRTAGSGVRPAGRSVRLESARGQGSDCTPGRLRPHGWGTAEARGFGLTLTTHIRTKKAPQVRGFRLIQRSGQRPNPEVLVETLLDCLMEPAGRTPTVGRIQTYVRGLPLRRKSRRAEDFVQHARKLCAMPLSSRRRVPWRSVSGRVGEPIVAVSRSGSVALRDLLRASRRPHQ
jgi:hypothetical protein